MMRLRWYQRCGIFVSLTQSSQDTRIVDGLMIQFVYYYRPAEVGTAEVTPCVIS